MAYFREGLIEDLWLLLVTTWEHLFTIILHPLSLLTYLLIFKTVWSLFSDTSQARTSGFSRS